MGGFALLAAMGAGATALELEPSARADASEVPTTDPAPEPTATVPSSPPVVAPVITYRTVHKRSAIPFRTKNVKTAALKKGVVKVKRAGRRGVRVTVYRITLRDGVGVGRTVVRKFVARHPVSRIVLHGTHVAAPKPKGSFSGGGGGCDPNYSGACVPIASDVDCGGGSGNGPAYVYGTVHVVGNDIYGLDSNGDGYGCE